MTQATALTALRERLDESAAGAWDDVQLRRWINEGVQDVCQRTECLQTSTTVAVTGGTRSYSLAQSIVRIYKVAYQPTGDSRIFPLEYRDFNAMDAIWWTQQAVTTNTPMFYTLWGYPGALSLVLYPTPVVNGNLLLHYYALPTPLATDGTAAASNLSLPNGWESMAVDYAEYMALRKDLQPRWREAKELYEQNVEKMMDLSRRWTDQAGVISAPGLDGSVRGLPAWLVAG